mgnify:CR=1 FL=1
MYKTILPLISYILFACTPHGRENLLADGGFEESAKMWDIGKSELTSEAHAGEFACALYVETPRYIPVWSDICIQKIIVMPGKEYRLSAFARMSLPPLTNGVYIGVRRPDGSVLKDRLAVRQRLDPNGAGFRFRRGAGTHCFLRCLDRPEFNLFRR